MFNNQNEELSKEEKLAAAKKRLKQFKKNNKENGTMYVTTSDYIKNELASIIQESSVNNMHNNNYLTNSSR